MSMMKIHILKVHRNSNNAKNTDIKQMINNNIHSIAAKLNNCKIILLIKPRLPQNYT